MKTYEAILAEEKAARAAFEAKETFKGEKIADLRKVFDGIKNPQNSKAPWAAAVPHQIVGLVLKAVEFFHADKAAIVGVQPITGKVLMSGNGYQAY